MPAAILHHRASDFRDQPWKNGGGTTRELRAAPHPAGDGRFAWRLSLATVAQSGPFSIFPGIDRVLLLLEGDGFALRFPDGSERLLDTPLRPLLFHGEEAVDCRLLGGTSRDFNLMTDRALYRATAEIHRAPARDLAATPLAFAYAVNGPVRISTAALAVQLAAGELAEIRDAERVSLVGEGTDVVWARLEPR